jgi:hypothetical protein
MLDPPLSVLPAAEPTPTQPIPDSVPVEVKNVSLKIPSILRTGDVLPTPSHGIEHHIHMAATIQFLQKPAALIQKNTFRIRRHCPALKITMGVPFANGPQKRWIMMALQ